VGVDGQRLGVEIKDAWKDEQVNILTVTKSAISAYDLCLL
jgi:hypothetical protein